MSIGVFFRGEFMQQVLLQAGSLLALCQVVLLAIKSIGEKVIL